MKKEILVNHPLVKHKVSILRNKNTGTKEFREVIDELATLICYEAMRDVELEEGIVETPITKTKSYFIDENKYAFIPILRAGLSMVNGLVNLIPNAKIGHIGIYRNEDSLEAMEYYFKVPRNIEDREIFLLDPMLATAATAISAVTQLKNRGAKKINFICIIAAPEGIEKLKQAHPDVQIYCATVDECLNENGYIVPGLGDAGDRIFGTK